MSLNYNSHNLGLIVILIVLLSLNWLGKFPYICSVLPRAEAHLHSPDAQVPSPFS